MIFLSCDGGQDFEPQRSDYEPILITRTEANNEIQLLPPRALTPGQGQKLYIFNNTAFQVELDQGLHVYDISNPFDPLKEIGFIYFRNITDVSISSGILHANQSVDFVSLNIQDLNNIYVVNREINVVNDIPPDQRPLKDKYIENRPPNTIVAKWVLENSN